MSEATHLDVDQAVRDRYEEAAQSRQTALCCPVDYDPQYLTVILYSSLYRAGNLLEQQGRANEAVQAYRAMLPYLPPVSPQSLEIHGRLSQLQQGLGRKKKAAEHREQAARIEAALGR